MPPKKTKEPKPVDAVDLKAKDPRWYDLFCILSDSADHLISGLLKRQDIPEDAKDILKGVLVLRESRSLFLAVGEDLKPGTALFLSEELAKWSAKQSAPE